MPFMGGEGAAVGMDGHTLCSHQTCSWEVLWGISWTQLPQYLLCMPGRSPASTPLVS